LSESTEGAVNRAGSLTAVAKKAESAIAARNTES